MNLFKSNKKVDISKSTITLISLLFIVLAINFATMPNQVFNGDPAAAQNASLNLINNRDISVPREHAFGSRGKFFYENIEKNKLYSKYGIMNTLMFVPPLILEKIKNGVIDENLKTIELLNAYNILLSIFIAWLLFKIASIYTQKNWIKIVFVLTVFYTTFTWHYLRAQSFEIFQLLFFLGFYYHYLKFLKQDSRVRNMFIAFLFLLCLILTKLIFILIIPILFIILLFQKIGWPKNPKNLADEIKNEFKKNFKQYLNYLIIPSIILISIALSVNYYKFGSPFNTGYTQWFLEKNIFSGNMFEGVYGFLFDKQWGIFICFPVLIFSLFGFSRFYKKYKTDFVFSSLILIVFLLTYSMFINWKGEWSYGPRYLLFILPIMALPFIEVLENLSKKNKLLIFLIVTILGYSAILQINNNSLGFFTYYQLERNFSSEEFIFGERNNATEPVFRRINNYFKTRHLGKMNQDFYNYLKYGKKFYPLEQVRLIITEESFIIFEYNFQKRVRALGQSNYYWFP